MEIGSFAFWSKTQKLRREQTATAAVWVWYKDQCTGYLQHNSSNSSFCHRLSLLQCWLCVPCHPPPLLLRQWWIRATLMTIIISDSRGKGWAKGASASSLDTRLCHCSDSHCSSLAYPLILETATAHSHALTPEWWSSSLSLFASSMVVVVCICLEVFLAADFLVDVGVA